MTKRFKDFTWRQTTPREQRPPGPPGCANVITAGRPHPAEGRKRPLPMKTETKEISPEVNGYAIGAKLRARAEPEPGRIRQGFAPETIACVGFNERSQLNRAEGEPISNVQSRDELGGAGAGKTGRRSDWLKPLLEPRRELRLEKESAPSSSIEGVQESKRRGRSPEPMVKQHRGWRGLLRGRRQLKRELLLGEGDVRRGGRKYGRDSLERESWRQECVVPWAGQRGRNRHQRGDDRGWPSWIRCPHVLLGISMRLDTRTDSKRTISCVGRHACAGPMCFGGTPLPSPSSSPAEEAGELVGSKISDQRIILSGLDAAKVGLFLSVVSGHHPGEANRIPAAAEQRPLDQKIAAEMDALLEPGGLGPPTVVESADRPKQRVAFVLRGALFQARGEAMLDRHLSAGVTAAGKRLVHNHFRRPGGSVVSDQSSPAVRAVEKSSTRKLRPVSALDAVHRRGRTGFAPVADLPEPGFQQVLVRIQVEQVVASSQRLDRGGTRGAVPLPRQQDAPNTPGRRQPSRAVFRK